MTDFDSSVLPEWQKDIMNKASQAQRMAIALHLRQYWVIVCGKFGGDAEMEKNGRKIKIRQDGQIVDT